MLTDFVYMLARAQFFLQILIVRQGSSHNRIEAEKNMVFKNAGNSFLEGLCPHLFFPS